MSSRVLRKNYFTDAKSINGVQNQMYIEKAPEGILKALN
jgi:hypothetical protein